MSQASKGEIDRHALYGRHDRVADARADIDTDQLRWRNRWAEKVAHRAVNQPLDVDPDDMHVDNRRYGASWKELSVLGVIVFGFAAILWQINRPEPPREPAPYNYVPPVHVPQQHVPQQRTEQPPHLHTDRDSLMIPRLRFGPER